MRAAFLSPCGKHKLKFLVSLALLSLLGPPTSAAESLREDSNAGRLTIMEENDKFASHDDRHYTQGIRFAYLSGPITAGGTWDQPFGMFSDFLPIFEGADRKRKIDWTVLGQSVFTPSDTDRSNPSRKDRPYAAWLYTGAGLLQETDSGSHHTLENAELLVGVVGPAALGGVTQNDFHQFMGVNSAMGWHNQLDNEPGLIATYERKWRFQQKMVGNFAVDAIPEMGASVGNILTYGQIGGMVRIGQNLGADYGPNRIRPSLSGTSWFNQDQLDGDFGWYLFLGTQGRIVGQNIFLDGNTFVNSPSVDKKLFVADLMAGASVFWSSDVRLDFTVMQRSKEFDGQKGHPDQVGGINIAFRLF